MQRFSSSLYNRRKSSAGQRYYHVAHLKVEYGAVRCCTGLPVAAHRSLTVAIGLALIKSIIAVLLVGQEWQLLLHTGTRANGPVHLLNQVVGIADNGCLSRGYQGVAAATVFVARPAGAAMTSRLYAPAIRAVDIAPPRRSLSTITVTSASPATMRLRSRKLPRCIAAELVYSVNRKPLRLRYGGRRCGGQQGILCSIRVQGLRRWVHRSARMLGVHRYLRHMQDRSLSSLCRAFPQGPPQVAM